MKKEKNIKGIWFLVFTAAVYILLFILLPSKTSRALSSSLKIFLKIIPIIAAVIIFTAVINYFISPRKIAKYMGRGSGIKGWLIAAGAGILSHGPVYFWYPLIKDLSEKGMTRGHTAVFLYNRAVKIPLIPIMVHYFGIKFVIVLSFYTIAGSFILGLIMNLLEPEG
ncbi:MAG: permease [Elusimicrobiota bacterium]